MNRYECECERGGDCTRITMCAVQLIVEELQERCAVSAQDYEQALNKIAELQAQVDKLEVSTIHDKYVSAMQTIEQLQQQVEQFRDEVRQFNDVTEYCTEFKIDCEPEVMQHWRNRFKAAINKGEGDEA